jgi:hypothetical protein
MSRVVDEAGKYSIKENAIGVSVISIEEDRVFKCQQPDHTYVNGQHVVLEPEIKLNLHLLFAAHFKLYDQALRYISYILTYFQSHPFFTSEQYANLDPQIGKLTMELQSLTYEQQNQVWAFIGGKQLPSLIYKMRMVVVQDTSPARIQPALVQVETVLGNR